MKREESENCDTVRDTDPGTAQAAWDADRALVGVDLFAQAAALDATAPGGFTTSRGAQLTLGF